MIRSTIVLLCAAFMFISFKAANAQTMSNYGFSASTGVSLIDISTGSTTLVSTGVDDQPSGLFDIGFPFTFMGGVYTHFSASPDGFIKFGAPAAVSQFTNSLTSTTNVPKVAPYWDDLATGTDGYVRYKTIGSAPNRQLVVEWFVTVPRNVSGAATATFQAVVSEGTGMVEFIYGLIPTGTASYSVGMTSSATQFASVTVAFDTVSYTAANNAMTTAIASGKSYTFTPPATVPASPISITFSAVMLTSMTVEWVDNSTDEVGFSVLSSTDGVNYTTAGHVTSTTSGGTGTGYSLNLTGLAAGTTYFFQITANTEGRSSVALTGSQSTTSPVPLVGGTSYPINGTEAPPTSFASVTSAYAYMSGNGVSGSGQVILELSTGYAGEPGPTTIGPIPGTSATLGVTFRPASGYTAMTSIPGAASPNQFAIALNGCQYVTLDGRAGGTGSTRSWTIQSTGSTNGQSAIRFLNTPGSTSNNTIKYCILNADATGTTAALVAMTVGTTGNLYQNNIIEHNLIESGPGTGLRAYAVSYGFSNTGAAHTGNVLRHNVIRRFNENGVRITGTVPGLQVHDNEVHFEAPLATGTTLVGIYFASTTSNTFGGVQIYNNFVHSLLSTNATTIIGLRQFSGSFTGDPVVFYNNRVALGTGLSTNPTIYGIEDNTSSSNSPDHFFYNSVYIGGTAASGSANSAAFRKALGNTLARLQNNVLYNARSNSAGTGTHWAVMLNSTTMGTIGNNDYFADGTGGVLGTTTGTTAGNQITIGAWQTAVPADAGSVSQNPNYLAPTATPPNLKIDASIPTQLESGGTPITGITTDFEGDTRNATTPDMGMDEFAGIAADLTAPVIMYTPLPHTSSTANRMLTATITDVASGVPTAGIGLPVLYWRVNAGTYSAATATSLGSDQYQFTFGAGATTGDTVRYYIAAQDGATPPNVSTQPSAGAGGFSANPPAASTPPTSPSTYLVTQAGLSGDYTVGTTAFNRVSGRNLSFEKFTRHVVKDVELLDNQEALQGTKQELAVPAVMAPAPSRTVRMEVEEEYWALVQNGRLYEGTHVFHPLQNSGERYLAVYATLTAAIADLNLRGVSGPTRFLLGDASFPEAGTMTIDITNEAVTNATNTVTIKPDLGVTTTVSTSSTSPVFIVLEPYVIFDGSNTTGTSRDMTITNAGTGASSGVGFVAGATNVVFKNLIGMASGPAVSFGIVYDAANNGLVENCLIKRTALGIQSQTSCNNFMVTNNDIGGSSGASEHIQNLGISILSSTNFTVSGNRVVGLSRPSGGSLSGILIGVQGGGISPVGGVISQNIVRDVKMTGFDIAAFAAYGIRLSSNATNADITVVNNIASDIFGRGDASTSGITFTPHGIYVEQGGGYRVYFNSVNMFGELDNPDATANRTGAMTVNAGVNVGLLDIRNNIFSNSQTFSVPGAVKKSHAIYSGVANTAFSMINYNDYYSTGPDGVLGYLGGDQTNLAAWQAATGQDANSIAADPLFVSSTDLRPFVSSPVLGAGVTIAGITSDFLGVTRGTPPTVGAYENAVAATMVYSSGTTTQANTSAVTIGSTNQEIIGIQVVTTGITSPISATRFLLGTNGSTTAADIANAKLFYTGTSGVFNTTSQFGSTVVSPNGAFVINGSQVLSTGTNYFWLTYDIAPTATHGNVVDGQCDSLYAGGSGHVPTVTAPAGSRTVTGVAVISTSPDSLVRSMSANSTATDTVAIRNTGNAPLTWSITDENDVPVAPNRSNLKYYLPGPELPKGVEAGPSVPAGLDSAGGPDAYGYIWIDSNEPGGPTFNWVDISATGTSLDTNSAWVPTGTNRPNDEGFVAVALPFPFNYYGASYDSLYIGTNGLCSFTRPVVDNFTNAPFPTAGGSIDNHLGVFWDDLEVRAGANIYYGLSGSDFVVQFDSMARFAGTVPNYTFELILSPNGNWKYQYLNMGFNGGVMNSASIGMENATGTVGLTVTHNQADITNNMAVLIYLPDAPWLSENPTSGSVAVGDSVKVAVTFNSTGLVDSTYRAILKIASNDPVNSLKTIPVRMDVSSGGTVTIGVPVANNWNIVSLPVSSPIPDDSVKHIYVNSANPYAFAFAGGYVQRFVMEPGPGYWIKSTTAYTQNITGTARDTLSIPVANNWNMIGSISTSIDTSAAHVTPTPASLRASNYFRYAAGYVVATTIDPGSGYWVKANGAGSFFMHVTGPSGKASGEPTAAGKSIEDLNTLTIQDASGGSQTLYFGADGSNEIPVAMFAMPPAPPVGSFDARFESAEGGLMVQTHGDEVNTVVDFPIAVQSSAPTGSGLTVSWKVNGTTASYELSDGVVSHAVRGEGTLKIANSEASHLVLKVTGSDLLPEEFALMQNYPNPFNPTTNIRFALPVESRVTVEIYNVLGQRVKTLINEQRAAGFHTVEWNGTGVSGQQLGSGAYFLRLEAQGTDGSSFNQFRKMVLVK